MFGKKDDNFIVVQNDADFEWQRAPRRRPGKALKAVLSVLLVAVISFASAAGAIWYYDGNIADKAAASEIIIRHEDVSPATQTSVKTEATALDATEIYAKGVQSAVLFTCKMPVEMANYGYVFGFGGNQPPQVKQYTTGYGSGVILSTDGYILTNAQVVTDAEEITVTLYDGRKFEAKVVGSDANSDVAVVKIDAQNLPAAEFGDSGSLLVGQRAYVIGNPMGEQFAFTLTCGYISAIMREVQIDNTVMNLMQVDAAVSPGNSGGPLLNDRGMVIGLINAKISASDVEGIGFAIPINTVLSVAQDLIQNGKVTTRPMLGITIESYSEDYAALYGKLPGITVVEVSEGSAAAEAGILAGDQITHFNGVAVSTTAQLNYQKEKCAIGDTVTITVVRDNQAQTLTVVLK